MRLTGFKIWFPLYLVCGCCCLPDGDLCRWMNGRKYYIDFGESGIISAENVTSQTRVGTPPMDQQQQIPQRCSVELLTCPACHFLIHAISINIPTCSADDTCRCDFVWLKETANSKSGRELCGLLSSAQNSSAQLVFESKTKQVAIDFLYAGSYSNAFVLQFSAIKNVYLFQGGYSHGNSTGVFGSPNFPNDYPSDYSAEYTLQNVDSNGFVQLLFTDFQLSLWSHLEILDSNGSRIEVYNGNTFRPPAIISSGPSLQIRFEANEEYPSSGFQATYTFVGYADKYWLNRPSTDCGGFVEDLGGAITMLNMDTSNIMRAYDCVWLIRPPSETSADKHVSVRVAQFEEMGSKSTLTICQGLYSNAPILESITPFQHHKLLRGREFVVSANVGFYIRLVGYFKNKSHLAIVYSTFDYEECYAVGEFECGNGRCIKNTLRCDGFNHCGDGSDEAGCYGTKQGTQSVEDLNWWRTLTPNYYFPKSESGNSSGTNTLILVTSLAGLGMFVLTTVVILVKLHKQRHDDTISREILQTISADIEAENALHRHHGGSDPPMYDPPPSYDDVVKFYLPPPPAYSRIGTNRNGQPRNTPPHATRTRTRKQKARKQTPSIHEPTVLQVVLPEPESPTAIPSDSSPVSCSSTRLPRTMSNKADDESDIQLSKSESSGNSPSKNICDCQGACSCNTHDVSSRRSLSVDNSDKESPRLADTISEITLTAKVLEQKLLEYKVDVTMPASHRRSSSDPETTNLCDKSPNGSKDLTSTAPQQFSHPNRSASETNDHLATGWGSLWNQVRHKLDTEESIPELDQTSWLPVDTQPLLSKLSSKGINDVSIQTSQVNNVKRDSC